MRRLRRWLLHSLAVLSLLLCVAIVSLWMRSYRHYMAIYWEAGEMPHDDRAIWEHNRWLGVNRGVVAVESIYQQWPSESMWSGPVPESHPVECRETDVLRDDWLAELRQYDQDPAIHTLRFARFELTYPRMTAADAIRHDPNGRLMVPYRLIAPAWAIASLFALLPAIRLSGWWRKRHSLRAGLCPSCSYDLTGNLSGVCPECGTAVANYAAPRRPSNTSRQNAGIPR